MVRLEGPATLTFHELIQLATLDPLPSELQAKLDRVLNEPFINNEAAFAGVKPNAPFVENLGPVLRVAEWNINRTPRESQVKDALAEKAAFLGQAARSRNSKQLQKMTEQLDVLQASDVVVLDEIDDGVARSNYENTPRKLAKALRMNYVFAVEFIELDNIYAAYRGHNENQPPSRDDQKFGIDPQRDRGLEGTALLSRYAIRDARIIRLPLEYDWYHDELKPPTFGQKVQNWYAANLLHQRVQRQIRRGSRVALVVDLDVPQSPTGVVTIVCPHLENYTNPQGRRAQMEYLLPRIAEIENPVIIAGDLNTTGRNAHATADSGFFDSLTSFRLWLPPVVFFFNPFPGVLFPWTLFKNASDPTAANVPVLAPNGSRALFDDLRQFRFADGGRFAWNGQTRQSYQGRSGTLSACNERARKGFAPTFFVGQTFHGLAGKYKIDWFLVKAPLNASNEQFQLAPFYGRTYPEINTALGKRISDHAPSSLDLPLTEPALIGAESHRAP